VLAPTSASAEERQTTPAVLLVDGAPLASGQRVNAGSTITLNPKLETGGTVSGWYYFWTTIPLANCGVPVDGWYQCGRDLYFPFHVTNYIIGGSVSFGWNRIDFDGPGRGGYPQPEPVNPAPPVTPTDPVPPVPPVVPVPPVGGFPDVVADSGFAGYISWLAEAGISGGFEDGTFRPMANVSRDAMAAFMFRAAGSTADFVAPTTPTFRDVPVTHSFFREIEWLAAQGISTGWPVGTKREFRAALPIERQAMAAFLFRFAGSPDDFTAPASSPFADVSTQSDFYSEIAWLADQQISTGWQVGPVRQFRPGINIERQAMAAFLHRFVHN
jgi:hypothetical protein